MRPEAKTLESPCGCRSAISFLLQVHERHVELTLAVITPVLVRGATDAFEILFGLLMAFGLASFTSDKMSEKRGND